MMLPLTINARSGLRLKRGFAAAVLYGLGAALLVTSPAPALAQDEVDEGRLRKIEAEIRALQRKVFPGGDGRFFEPQIAPEETTTQTRTGGPSTTAVTDILARLDAIEAELQRFTARNEEMSNVMVQLEERVAALESAGTVIAPLPEAETVSQNADEAPTLAPENTLDEQDTSATGSNLAAMGARAPSASPSASPSNAQSAGGETETPAAPQPVADEQAAAPSAERLAAVQEITKPQSGDAGDDEYSYGFRLWRAGFFPEARQQLASFVEDYPDHWRVTFGRNLLGRAYLDDGRAEDAARWFLRNYQTDRTSARAPDSLLYLSESMIALEDTRRACIALAEFGETYPALASGRLMDQYERNRRSVTCE
ncbi:MAG: tetratricopeptide repeat protein [Pseudomonadota bacterium]